MDGLPKHIYRYRPASSEYFFEELKQAIRHAKIFLSSAASLNDPMDFRPSYENLSLRDFNKEFGHRSDFTKGLTRSKYNEIYGTSLSRDEFRKLGITRNSRLQNLDLRRKVFLKSFNEMPNRTRLACFSEAECSIPMWAHYAEDHSGVSLQYEVDWNVGRSPEGKVLAPVAVEYIRQRPVIEANEWANYMGRGNAELDDVALESVMAKLCLAKSFEWAYERERRIFLIDGEAPKYWEVPHLQVKSLRLGLRIDSAIKKKIISEFGGSLTILQSENTANDFLLNYVAV